MAHLPFFHSSAGAGSGGGFGSFEDAEAANAREAVRAAAELKKRQEDEDAALARALQEAETEYDDVVDHMCFPAVSNLMFACGDCVLIQQLTRAGGVWWLHNWWRIHEGCTHGKGVCGIPWITAVCGCACAHVLW